MYLEISLLLEILSYLIISFEGGHIFRREEIKKSANSKKWYERNLKKVSWCSPSGRGVKGGEGSGKFKAEGSKSKSTGTEKVQFHESRKWVGLTPRCIPRAQHSACNIGSSPFIFKMGINKSVNYRQFSMASGWKWCVRVYKAVNLRDKQGQIVMILVGQALDLGFSKQKEAFGGNVSKWVIWPQLHFGKSFWELCEEWIRG